MTSNYLYDILYDDGHTVRHERSEVRLLEDALGTCRRLTLGTTVSITYGKEFDHVTGDYVTDWYDGMTVIRVHGHGSIDVAYEGASEDEIDHFDGAELVNVITDAEQEKIKLRPATKPPPPLRKRFQRRRRCSHCQSVEHDARMCPQQEEQRRLKVLNSNQQSDRRRGTLATHHGKNDPRWGMTLSTAPKLETPKAVSEPVGEVCEKPSPNSKAIRLYHDFVERSPNGAVLGRWSKQIGVKGQVVDKQYHQRRHSRNTKAKSRVVHSATQADLKRKRENTLRKAKRIDFRVYSTDGEKQAAKSAEHQRYRRKKAKRVQQGSNVPN